MNIHKMRKKPFRNLHSALKILNIAAFLVLAGLLIRAAHVFMR